jgi:DHA2 family multidrug resistance protein-like MFS transporter
MTTSTSRRWWALGAIVLAVLAVTLDVTVLTVALPSLAVGLSASESQLQWFVTAYTLALVAGMLPAGLTGDRYGRRALMAAALALFAVGSAGCAFAPDPAAFILARVALGLAGAAIIVMALSIITVMFSEEERPRAIGIWGAANFIGLPLGPILGGWILTNAWWGWIFLLNVPVALMALVVVLALVPESRAAPRPGIDVVGVGLSSSGLVALMYGSVEAGDNGWDSPSAILPVVVGLLVLGTFVLWERRLTARPDGQPLVDLSLFRSRSFTWGVILTAFGVFGLFGALFALPQYFQAIMGVDPQGSGIRLLPVVAGLIVGAVTADRLAARLGTKATVAAGFAVSAAALAVGTTTTTGSSDAFLAAWTFVVGAGGGLGFATAASAAIVGLPADRSGVGSALLQVIVKLGPAFGATILGSVLNATYLANVDVTGLTTAGAAAVQSSVFGGIAVAQQLASPELLTSVRSAFVVALDQAMRIAAVVDAVAVGLALAFLPARVGATRVSGTAAPSESGSIGAIDGAS